MRITSRTEPLQGAKKLAANLKKFETSTKDGCKSLGDVWFTTPEKGSLCKPSKFPFTVTLREGKVPGEGFTNASGMSFRWCPPGKFTMGTDDSGNSYTRDRQPVDVTLSKGFWIGQYEVTQREYSAVMRKNPPRGFTVGLNAPWFGIGETKQVLDFCKKLTDIEKKAKTLPDGWKYTLMSEAQWEYACRAGLDDAFGLGVAYQDDAESITNLLLERAWFDANSDGSLRDVGTRAPNRWGLHDMRGNAAEWTLQPYAADRYASLSDGPAAGGEPATSTRGRGVVRGGAFDDDLRHLRCADRFEETSAWKRRDPQVPKSRWWNTDSPHVGLRLVSPERAWSTAEITAYWDAILGAN